MYFERGGLIVWALVLFTTTCFVLTPGVPTTSDPPDPEKTSKSPQSSTSQVTLPETEDNGGQGKNGNETAKTVTASEGPTKHVSEGEEDSNEPLVKKGKTEGMLYYEITKRINKRNLTLGDIKEVLFKKDDEILFIYTLADKLGYVVNEEYDDPHIPVIKSKKDKLFALLVKKARLSTPPAQEEADEDSAVSETPPISSEPAAHSDKQKIAFEVTKAIDKLEAEAIDALLSNPTLSGFLGYAVGNELGYSDNNERMKYLENMGEENLRNHMHQILESKMPSKKKTPTFDGEGPEDQTQETSGGIVPNRNGQTQGVDEDTNNPPLEPSLQVTRPSEGAGKASTEEPNEEGSPTENEGLSQQSGVVSPSKNGGPSPTPKQSGNNDPWELEQQLTFEDEFMKYLQKTNKELYDHLLSGDAGRTVIEAAMKLYDKWEPEDYPDIEEGSEGETKPGGDTPAQSPEVKGEVEGEVKGEVKGEVGSSDKDVDFDADGSLSSSGSSSSFGAWHFLSIFLVLGVVVVIGYLCVHNRKKVREGVASYINDSSKRRRRAREYQPLVST